LTPVKDRDIIEVVRDRHNPYLHHAALWGQGSNARETGCTVVRHTAPPRCWVILSLIGVFEVWFRARIRFKVPAVSSGKSIATRQHTATVATTSSAKHALVSRFCYNQELPIQLGTAQVLKPTRMDSADEKRAARVPHAAF
jgi:hypothetical protein